MTKEEILKRIQELTAQKQQQEQLCEQTKANANACSGAIQELTRQLKKLEKDEADKLAAEKQNKEQANDPA